MNLFIVVFFDVVFLVDFEDVQLSFFSNADIEFDTLVFNLERLCVF